MTRPPLLRPHPIRKHRARPIDLRMSPAQAADLLCTGEPLLVTDAYTTAEQVMHALQYRLPPPPPDAGYVARRRYRKSFRATAERLLVPVHEHRVALADAPHGAFLPELYPELPDFFLPFIDADDLHHGHVWFQRGVPMAVLGASLHPFYGTYAPTRTSHLELFATWLSGYKGAKRQAIDVGTGCGVLAFLLAKRDFQAVLATDINPNALESVARDKVRWTPTPPISLQHGDLLGDLPPTADLIVFNPPWTPGEVEGPLDRALHYDDDIFERFFDQVDATLALDGRVVLLFSNLISLVQPDAIHPIEAELAKGRFTLVQKMQRKVKPPPPRPGEPRRNTKERVEVWELGRV